MAHWNSFSLPKKKWWFSISLKVISGYIPKKIKRYNMAILVIKMVIKSPEGISLFFPTTSHWCCRGLLTPVARPGGPGWTLSRTNAPHGLPGEDRVWGGWIKMFSGRGEFLGYSNYYWINIFIGSYLFYIYIYSIYIIILVTIVIMMILLFFDVNYRSLVCFYNWEIMGFMRTFCWRIFRVSRPFCMSHRRSGGRCYFWVTKGTGKKEETTGIYRCFYGPWEFKHVGKGMKSIKQSRTHEWVKNNFLFACKMSLLGQNTSMN